MNVVFAAVAQIESATKFFGRFTSEPRSGGVKKGKSLFINAHRLLLLELTLAFVV